VSRGTRLAPLGSVFKLLLISVVAAPVLLGMQAARVDPAPRRMRMLAGLVLSYDVAYMLMLYYLRVRWLGW